MLNFTSQPMLRDKRDLSQMPVVFIPEVWPVTVHYSNTLPSANSEGDSDHNQEPHQGNMIDALEMTLTMTMVIWKLPSR